MKAQLSLIFLVASVVFPDGVVLHDHVATGTRCCWTLSGSTCNVVVVL